MALSKLSEYSPKVQNGEYPIVLSPIHFHGDTIFCCTYQNQPYTPMKPIVENMGLDWQSQATKFRANKERWGVVIIATPSKGGEQQSTCMPVRKLPAWLNSINPKKVRPELRAKIELYQNESDDALWNYWVNGRAERPCSNAGRPSRRSDPERKALTAIINTWVGMAPIHYASARAQVNAHFGVTSVDALTVAQVKEAIQWVQAKIDALPAVPAPARPPVLPASSIYADRMKALTDLEKRFMEFAGETRTRLSELNAEYVRLNQGAYAAMLGLIPSIQPGSKDRLIDALASQSYDAYNWIDEGLQRMRLAIIAARAANRTIAEAN
jgi:hypothetical protein